MAKKQAEAVDESERVEGGEGGKSDRAEKLKFACTINNRSIVDLKVNKSDTEIYWGKWEDAGNFYPVDIPARRDMPAFRTSGRAHSSSGTEGVVVYNLAGSNEWIRIYWDVPWGSRYNKLQIKTSDPDIIASQQGWVGEGASEFITLTVADLRDIRKTKSAENGFTEEIWLVKRMSVD